MSQEYKRRRGDRRDGRLLREMDAMHFVTAIIYPNRCDNEAYISENIELAPINAYLAKKNEGETEFPYTMFHVIVAALLKTITLRPKLNRFICDSNYYQRHEITASFVIKKKFNDHSEEGVAFIRSKEETTLDTLHEELRRQITSSRSGGATSTEDTMDILNKLPRWLSKWAIRRLMWLDRHGWVPESFIHSDPYYASVILSNVGSIKLKSGYHHLTNWGTCSLFCLIGEKTVKPVFAPDGSYEMREVVPLGLTIDERLADGYYYSKSIRLLKYLLAHPELLERPLTEEVDYE